jgi:hypothetical protein
LVATISWLPYRPYGSNARLRTPPTMPAPANCACDVPSFEMRQTAPPASEPV